MVTLILQPRTYKNEIKQNPKREKDHLVIYESESTFVNTKLVNVSRPVTSGKFDREHRRVNENPCAPGVRMKDVMDDVWKEVSRTGERNPLS